MQGYESDVHAAIARAGFSRAVDDVGMNGISESGLVLLGNGGIGLGRELDLEGTVCTGPGSTMRDFLGRRRRERSPPVVPTKPRRKSHLTHYAILDLGVVYGSSRIGHGRTSDLHLAVEHGGLGRGVHGYLKLGSLVLLDIHVGGTARGTSSLDLYAHPAHQAIPRSGKTAVERAVVIRTMLGPRNFLVVAVAKNDREVTIRDHLVIVVRLVDAIGNTLVSNGLSGTVEATVGKENGAFVRFWIIYPVIDVIIIGRGQGLPLVRGQNSEAGTIGLQFEKAVCVGSCGSELDPAIISLSLPSAYGGSLNGFARNSIEDKSFNRPGSLAGTHDQGKVAHPEARITNAVFLVSELGVMTGEKKVGTGLEAFGSGNLFHPLLEVFGRRQIDGPFLDGFASQPFGLGTMVDVFGMTLSIL